MVTSGHSSRVWRLFVTCLAAGVLQITAAGQSAAPRYEVYALRFADVPFSVGSLVAGADRARTIDIACTVWAMKGAAVDAKMFAGLKAAGRVQLVDGDSQQILHGITVYTGGKHTFASQYAAVQTRAGLVVLASDNAYLYENLERHLAIAQTLDAAQNLAAQDRMVRLAAALRFVVPGHDPAVFDRFAPVRPGVVRID